MTCVESPASESSSEPKWRVCDLGHYTLWPLHRLHTDSLLSITDTVHGLRKPSKATWGTVGGKWIGLKHCTVTSFSVTPGWGRKKTWRTSSPDADRLQVLILSSANPHFLIPRGKILLNCMTGPQYPFIPSLCKQTQIKIISQAFIFTFTRRNRVHACGRLCCWSRFPSLFSFPSLHSPLLLFL